MHKSNVRQHNYLLLGILAYKYGHGVRIQYNYISLFKVICFKTRENDSLCLNYRISKTVAASWGLLDVLPIWILMRNEDNNRYTIPIPCR